MALLLPLVALLFAAICTTVQAIPTISAVGSKFFTSDGNQFFIKGESQTQPNVLH
jgi:1,3-beta-glucanosyltransferase GAS1